jgi:hypothetical protein
MQDACYLILSLDKDGTNTIFRYKYRKCFNLFLLRMFYSPSFMVLCSAQLRCIGRWARICQGPIDLAHTHTHQLDL